MSKDLATGREVRGTDVVLPSVRSGLHWYEVKYSYYDKQDHMYRKEASALIEAYTAADAVCQVAIDVDNRYGQERCKILSVRPHGDT